MLNLQIDHRSSLRSAAKRELPVTLELREGDLFHGTVMDVSNRGVGLRLEVPTELLERAKKVGGKRGRLRIGPSDTPLLDQTCTVRHATLDMHPNLEQHAVVGVAFAENQSLPIDQLEFMRGDEEIDLIHTPEGIAELMGDLALVGEKAMVSLKAEENTFRGIYRHDLQPKAPLSLKIELLDPAETEALTDKFEYTFHMEIFGSFYLFRSRIQKQEGRLIDLSVPKGLVRITRRITQRVAPREGETFLARFADPFTGEKIEAKLENFTERGFSAVVEDEQFMLPAGMLLPDIELNFENGPTLMVSGALVRCTQKMEGRATLGLNIAHNDPHTLMPLFDFVVSRRYPDVVDIGPEQVEANWVLFEKAGYLHEKDPASFELIRPDSTQTWKKLAHGKGEIARNFGIAKHNELLGGLHLTRLHSNTWIIHHLSILSGHQRYVTQPLFGAMCDYHIQVGAEHSVSYTNATASWNQKNYYSFVKEVSSPEDNVLKKYHLYELDLGPREKVDNLPTPSVRPASKYDLMRIAKYLEGALPRLQIDAFDLKRETIEGDLIQAKYENHDLLRDRKFLVWGPHNQFVAFAMCDIASSAINIFGLLDKVEIHFVNPMADKSLAYASLLQAVKKFYLAAEKKTALFLGDPEDQEAISASGYRSIIDLNMWISSRKMIPRYREYNARLFGRMIARIQKRGRRATPTDAG